MIRIGWWVGLLFVGLVAGGQAAAGGGIAPLAFTSSSGLATTSAIVAGSLSGGRFILYDGNGDIWIEAALGAGTYTKVASGYFGDPGSISVAPNGHTCLVSSGYLGSLWLFDANAPADAGTPLFTLPGSYWAAWIDGQHLLIDYAQWVGPGTYDYQASVGLLDISTFPPQMRTVITGGRAASAALSVGNGYAYVTDGMTGATNRFAVADLLNAFAASTPLTWPGTPNFGTFNAGGSSAVTNTGVVVFQGNTIQYVDVNGTVLGTDNPNSASPYPIYTATYNPATGYVFVVSTDWSAGWPPVVTGWGSEEAYDGPAPAVPAGGPAGLLLLGGMFAAGGFWAASRRDSRCA